MRENEFLLTLVFLYKGTFIWESKWAQTGMRFHFGWKPHFVVQSAGSLCSHELRQNETQTGIDFISVILTDIKFQTGIRCSSEQSLLEVKWVSADSLNIAFNCACVFETECWCYYIMVIMTEMKFHFGW